MRISPPVAVLTAIAAAIAGLAWRHQGSERKLQVARCNVAVAYIANFTSQWRYKPLYFVADWIGDSKRIDIDKFLATREGRKFKDDPTLPLARQQQTILGQNAVGRCSSVRAFLSDQKIRYGKLRGQSLAQGPYGFECVGLSMPAVDLIKGSAMFDVERSAGPLAGEGSSVIMRRDEAGSWQTVSEDVIWVS